MGDLTPAEWALVIRAVAPDPEIAEELRPLLAGNFGPDARRLVLCRLAARLAAGASVRGALVVALAHALCIAGEEQQGR